MELHESDVESLGEVSDSLTVVIANLAKLEVSLTEEFEQNENFRDIEYIRSSIILLVALLIYGLFTIYIISEIGVSSLGVGHILIFFSGLLLVMIALSTRRSLQIRRDNSSEPGKCVVDLLKQKEKIHQIKNLLDGVCKGQKND